MSRCEDYPCCGHGPPPLGDGGGCPVQTDDGPRYRCVECGVLMQVGAASAMCAPCGARGTCRRCGEDYLDCLCDEGY